ncbi:DUF4861 family protein [Cellulophaga sp. E16_2]|uniref:DUF4861 family protein n=1 Tax=Cellulophaga sp. E16_2 TaxID=2789297 RepID=UPI001A9238AC|nr:DUF4861 family protein [Cellulophaga sp. E16_2]MBO0593204.1 DUF4861 family protein [Cellulophaga sp. E16_2]
MNIFKLFGYFISIIFFSSCAQEEKIKAIVVKNALEQERTFETVEISKSFLNVDDLSTIGIRSGATKKLLVTQLVDNDGDGVMDLILFQPEIKANSEAIFNVVTISESERPTAAALCYSRFVPERTDDYTWENDKVAFRVYGPKAQRMIEEDIPGGTLSSGVDAWLKKVEYPIINNWYHKELETEGTYHEDTGEGLDNFHVGKSRGVGGIAVKKDSTYYFSKNYTTWRTITTGPLRTSVYLEYENWDAGGNIIKESKIISLDLGSHLSKFNINLVGANNVFAGLTLDKKDGIVSGSKDNGWVTYWQSHTDSEIGTAIVAAKKNFKDFEKYDVLTTDLSNIYVHLNMSNNQVVYYSGFGWKEQGDFTNDMMWDDYIADFALKINNPLTLSLRN